MEPRRFPLGGTERRLQERLQHLLGKDERLQAAVVAFTGPRAGIEALFVPLFGLLSMFVNATRTITTVAVTERGVVLFDTRGLRRPTQNLQRFDSLAVLGPINDTDGDSWIQVAGTKFWIEGIWSSELYVINQLKRRTS